MILDHRTELWAIWRACERLGVRPPGVGASWDETNVWGKAQMIAYDQICNHDHSKHEIELLRAQAPRGIF